MSKGQEPQEKAQQEPQEEGPQEQQEEGPQESQEEGPQERQEEGPQEPRDEGPQEPKKDRRKVHIFDVYCQPEEDDVQRAARAVNMYFRGSAETTVNGAGSSAIPASQIRVSDEELPRRFHEWGMGEYCSCGRGYSRASTSNATVGGIDVLSPFSRPAEEKVRSGLSLSGMLIWNA